MLPKARAYVKSYDMQTKWMDFLVEYDDVLEKYNAIWNKASADIINEFDRDPVYNKEFLKTKIKSHSDKVTDIYDKESPKVESNYTCLVVIRLDFTLKKDNNYYLLVFLKECKYIEKKVIRHINEILNDFSSDDESDKK